LLYNIIFLVPPFYFTIPLRSGFGAFTGFFAGMFAKELTRTLVFYLGLGISTIALLNYYKYITINWKKIDEDLFNFVTKKRTRKDVNRLTEYVKRFFTHVLPISAGFFGAFYYAFKYS
jgi:uncharacterized membrane protein (Fun14 family)